MNIHEYQAKKVFAEHGLPVLGGGLAHTPAEAVDVATKLGGSVWVVKAQIHAGGRGKGGGVKIARSLAEVESLAQSILGMNLVTPQTGKEGKTVHKVYIEQGCDIEHEYYLSILLDRARSCCVVVASSMGGMDIEAVAEEHPDKIIQIPINPTIGIQAYHGRQIAFALGLKGDLLNQFTKLLANLFKVYNETDASLIEINPLVVTADKKLCILDAKVGFDDNALFRHKDLQEMYDPTEDDPIEEKAKQLDLNYVKLDGNIGCMVNGAGLAMATMDIIQLHGGTPANFLDIGGGANQEKVTAAFKIILSDTNVKSIWVNIFGGIMRCDIIAQGIVAAAKEIEMKVPIVVRLEGTNVEQGRSILRESGLKIEAVNDFSDAARKAVELAGGPR